MNGVNNETKSRLLEISSSLKIKSKIFTKIFIANRQINALSAEAIKTIKHTTILGKKSNANQERTLVIFLEI